MSELEIKVTPFKACPFLYQQIIKLGEECGEVAQAYYRCDHVETVSDNLCFDSVVIECGDVIQTAINIIVRCGYDVQDVMDIVTAKNSLRGHYDA